MNDYFVDKDTSSALYSILFLFFVAFTIKFFILLFVSWTESDFIAAAVQFYSVYPDSFFEEVIRNTNNSIVTYASWPFSTLSNLSIRVITGNLESVPFTAAAYRSTDTLITNVIAKIESSGYIRAKNAFEKPPLIRLYDIFYPGEWYAPNAFGNPSKAGQGSAWPFGLPYRFAEVRGDTIADLSYRAWHDGDAYLCYPIDSGNIGLNQTGEINETTVTISNFDSLIAQVVENSFLVVIFTLSLIMDKCKS